jgi:spermidine/putrescine transport system permease protein
MRKFDPMVVYGVAFLVFLYAPVLLIPLFSFNDSTVATFPMKGFTFNGYRAMAADISLMNALKNSIVVGLGVSVVSTVFGMLAAMGATRYVLPGRGPVMGTIMLPLVVPSLIISIALLVILRKVFDVPLSLWTVAAGHVLVCVPFSMLTLIARLEGFDKGLEEASNDLGESAWMTFWRVTFPIALPGIVASLLMCFTISFDEFVMAFFLSGTDQTLPVFLYSQLRFPNKLPPTLSLGSTILAASIVIVIISEWLRRRGVQSSAPGAF